MNYKKINKYCLISLMCLLVIYAPNLYADSWCEDLVGVWTFIGRLIQIAYVATPVLLIVSGSITFFKAIADTKDSNALKKAQDKFVKKIVAALLVFLVISIVKIVVGLIGDDGWMQCAQCAINPNSGGCSVEFGN